MNHFPRFSQIFPEIWKIVPKLGKFPKFQKKTMGSRATGCMQAVRQIGHTPMAAAVPGFPARILLQQRPPSPATSPTTSPATSPATSVASNQRAAAVRAAHIRRSFVSSWLSKEEICARCENWMGGSTSLLLAPPERDEPGDGWGRDTRGSLAYGLGCQHVNCQQLLLQW